MSTMVKTYCNTCNKECSEVSSYDLQFISETTCWECIFKSCPNCNGHGMIGWASPDGDFDFEYCECNPLHLSIDEVRNV